MAEFLTSHEADGSTGEHWTCQQTKAIFDQSPKNGEYNE